MPAAEEEGGGRARDKPEEFGDHGAEEDAFCGEEGRMGVPVGEESSNLRGRGAKRDCVPVPVLCHRQ